MSRADFPIFNEAAGSLVYLDNAATTQKPRAVIDALSEYYRTSNANVHRAAHALSARATQQFEAARETVRDFVNAESSDEIIFTRGTTESINLIANVYRGHLKPDDEILISHLEHHSNIVPWQMLAAATGARVVACDVTQSGELDMEDFDRLLNERTRIVAIGHVSNALGTVNPIEDIISRAHSTGAIVVVDGAQAVAHMPVDVQALDCDFYAFSGHKLYGPTGIGVLYGRRDLLEMLPPWQGGGEMIEHVTIEQSTYNRLPYKFEAGTPHIAGAIGLAAAIDYLLGHDWKALQDDEQQLLNLCLSELRQMPQVRLVGEPQRRTGVISFLVEGSHPHDIGTLVDQQGVAVRTGHHCTMPLMAHFGIPGTIRASFAMYNTRDDVASFSAAMHKALTFV
jgi:SufS family cysteine desulfurase